MRIEYDRLFAALGLAAMLGAAPVKADAPAPMRLTLDYDGHLIFKVLEMRLDEQVTPDGFGASVSLNASGILKAFKPFDIQASARGRAIGGALRPWSFAYVNHDGKRIRHLDVTWNDDDVVMNTTPAFSDLGEPPATTAQKLAAADPLTQIVRITLASAQAGPCNGDSHFFDGKQYYRLSLVPDGAATLTDHARELGLVNPVRCVVKYHEIAGFKPKPPEKRDGGLKSPITVTFGQLGAGGPWVIARMQAETPLGYANIDLHEAKLSRGGV